MKVSVADAKNKLPELIKAVENGETVTIYRRGSESTEHRTAEIPDHPDADALHRVFTPFALGIDSGPIAGYPDTICLPDALTGESPWAWVLPHMTGAQNASLKSDVKDVSGIFDHYRMSARAIQN